MPPMPWTLQPLIDERMTVTAYCHNSRCHHNQPLNLEALLDRLGPDMPAMADDLIPKLKCGRCHDKKIGLIYTPGPDDRSGRVGLPAHRGNAAAFRAGPFQFIGWNATRRRASTSLRREIHSRGRANLTGPSPQFHMHLLAQDLSLSSQN